jgi:hypothetical protein
VDADRAAPGASLRILGLTPRVPANVQGAVSRIVIHATNAWNPTGRNLLSVPGTRLFYAHAESLSGPRTYVFLGTQQHLTFVADLEGHVPADSLRDRVLHDAHLYPHLVDAA